ncbi:hypothetical protein KIF24_13235 [Micromonospora sp. Llam7]|uniref:hypothetical protein n=1 Tax=Micromonospora tarapacensis TaxID=2835305 RepID=UPI001C829C79|nr:hypothetical protein [Micromonospora tarapacensis]MBX7266893.1 hypothetical protein [Micromonospora tarapacensis]
MESRWRDLVILDYEVDFPAASRLELALYSAGAALFPRVLLGEPAPWGRHRRPGVLEIPAVRYDRLLDDFGARCADPSFVRRLGARLHACLDRLARATRRLEPPAPPRRGRIVKAVEALAELMAFHVLNWALPLDDIRRWLARLTGSPHAARGLLMRLLVPTNPAHLADFAALAASAHHDLRAGDWSPRRAAQLATDVGHLQSPGLARPFDDPAVLETYLRSLGPDDAAYLDAMRSARDDARRRLARDTALLLLTAGDAAAVARTWALTTVCRLAAEEEEQRRRWQGRSLRAIGTAAAHQRVAPDRLLPRACHLPPTPPEAPRPIVDPTAAGWAWLSC